MIASSSSRMFPFSIKLTIIGVLLIFVTGASGVEDRKAVQTAENIDQVQNFVSIVKKAIISGDYSTLRTDSKKKKTRYHGTRQMRRMELIRI